MKVHQILAVFKYLLIRARFKSCMFVQFAYIYVAFLLQGPRVGSNDLSMSLFANNTVHVQLLTHYCSPMVNAL